MELYYEENSFSQKKNGSNLIGCSGIGLPYQSRVYLVPAFAGL